MGKQVKLPPKKSAENITEKANEKEAFYFFAKDQGTGAGKVFVIILKVLELIVTTIFAFVLGIFGPLCIWNGDIVEAEVASDPSALWWLISSIFYVVGMFVMMLGHTKTAAVIHVFAAAGTLITYSFFIELYKPVNSSGPTMLYMPSLLITLLSIGIMLIVNVPKWMNRRIEKDSEVAPSILGDSKKR